MGEASAASGSTAQAQPLAACSAQEAFPELCPCAQMGAALTGGERGTGSERTQSHQRPHDGRAAGWPRRACRPEAWVLTQGTWACALLPCCQP